MQGDAVTGLFVGRSTLDLVYACARFPEPDGKVDAASGYMTSGGPALNAAAAFAGLGGRALLFSVIGEGLMADWVRADIDRCGLEVFDAAEGLQDVLPVSSVILSGASRAIVNQPLPAASGVSSAEPPAAVTDRLWRRLDEVRPDVVLSDGHLPGLALPVLRWARAAGVRTVLDGGSWKAWTGELLPLIDVAVVSARFHPPGAGAHDPRKVLQVLSGSIGAVAVTNGPGPILWRSGREGGEIRPPPVAAVDTLGAGDIFHGAFCRRLAAGDGLEASLAAAAEVASRSCTSWGPRSWMADGAPAVA